MKVILTGATGFVGHEILNQCLQNPVITSIVALSRRDLPAHDKLQVIKVEDFLSYPDSINEGIRGAEACIWALGKARIPDEETARRISIDYTLSAARLFQENCQKPFRFLYCSGAAAERDQTKPLWFMQEYRRIRGQVENELLAFANNHSDFKAYIVRPAMVLSRETSMHSLVFGLGPSIKVDTLAGSMVELALKGGEKSIWENVDLNQGR
ncbi:uncharacterized protein N7459_000312 [Penicillium hispanicum]|uniref:uncharacterized protein n=1 Tax=Penicillium hispanicum TaxID=1080232 RepID=UPI00254243E4|nr:uncharacterized protein N7459_000312 [Penicillium hispanicum]KAJ5594104.1 hypothetical protein N7459_000312 [Penicillium hispanicum]